MKFHLKYTTGKKIFQQLDLPALPGIFITVQYFSRIANLDIDLRLLMI